MPPRHDRAIALTPHGHDRGDGPSTWWGWKNEDETLRPTERRTYQWAHAAVASAAFVPRIITMCKACTVSAVPRMPALLPEYMEPNEWLRLRSKVIVLVTTKVTISKAR